MSAAMIQELHAAISRRDWTATEAAANSIRDDIDATVKILAGPSIGSLPRDYPIHRLASDVETDRRERVRQCDLMAKDWADFCETMEVQWDTQEAVAHQLKSRAAEFSTQLLEAVKASWQLWLEYGQETDPEMPVPAYHREMERKIEAAIAKAEGRS